MKYLLVHREDDDKLSEDGHEVQEEVDTMPSTKHTQAYKHHIHSRFPYFYHYVQLYCGWFIKQWIWFLLDTILLLKYYMRFSFPLFISLG